MLEFLKNYGYFVLLGFVLLLEIILILVKKRPKTLDDFLSVLYKVSSDFLPGIILKVERSGSGEAKKQEALSFSYKFVKHYLNRDLSKKESEIFNSFFSEQIEKILLTPEKKKGE